ncbi:MAG TPA: thioredoxin domain-containing protein [Candidatus Acidoferrales bacterium]|nr:thioredoxin domain-containing protein [Candidatus Acidoferrales bacterium]
MNLRRPLPIFAALLLGIAALCFVMQQSRAQATPSPAEVARWSAEKSLGSPSAPIKMIVYDDYECPACGNFYEQTLRTLIDTYVADGKVYLVHRDFPLPMHEFSRQAARWVNAAARIGKFEAVERALFDNQMAWSEYGSENPKGIIKPIVQSALTPAEFKRVERIMQGCESNSHDELKGCAVDAEIQRNIAAGELLPIAQTPTFVVSYKGQTYPPAAGGVSWPLLKQFFDQLLSQK